MGFPAEKINPWKVIALIFALFISPCFAAEKLSLEFDSVSVVELSRIVFVEVLKRPIVFTPEALASKEIASISLRGLDSPKMEKALVSLMQKSGLSVTDNAGVLWIDRRTAADDSDFIYRPRYRATSYLVDLLAPLFKPGAFTSQRGGVSNSQSNMGGQMQAGNFGTQSQGASNVQQPTVADNGNSAYSLYDKQQDIIFFHGTATDIQRLQSALDRIDTKTPELYVKAVVYEVTTTADDSNAVSLALSILKGRVNLGSVTPGSFSGVFHAGKLDVVIDALAKDSRFKVVSSPSLRVRSGSSARLTVGTQTPVLGATSLAANGTTVQSVEYKPSGVILDIKPDVRADISDLKISQQISNFVQTDTGVNTSPTLVTRELSTFVGVKEEDVLVLDGLDENRDTEAHTGLSFLPRWFGANTASKSRTEVLIVLQATRI